MIGYGYDSLCPPPTQELRVVCAESSSLELFRICDANDQNICWDRSKCNHRGEKLFDFITSAGVMTARVVRVSICVGLKRSEAIDLKICSSKIKEWVMLAKVSMSDLVI